MEITIEAAAIIFWFAMLFSVAAVGIWRLAKNWMRNKIDEIIWR